MTLLFEAILVSRLDYCGPKLNIFRTLKFLERLTKALILQVELMAIHGSAIFGSVNFFVRKQDNSWDTHHNLISLSIPEFFNDI